MQVYVFHGIGSKFANAVFSTRESAEAWIALHGVTGLLTGYELDAPAFDRRLNEGKLPPHIRKPLALGEATSEYAQRYADGAVHSHYFYGLGADSPGYSDAVDRWHRDNDEGSE